MHRNLGRHRSVLLSLAGLASLLSGCVVTDHTLYDAARANRATAIDAAFTAPQAFDYPRSNTAPIVTETSPGFEGYRSFSIVGPEAPALASPDLHLEANLYLSEQLGIDRLVIVLPIWGSADFPQRKVVKSLLDWSGGRLHVLEVVSHEAIFRWTELADAQTETEFFELAHESSMRVAGTVTGIRRLVDWVDPYGDLEIDLVGFSMGALVGAITIGVDDRLSSGVLMLGGSDPAGILANCSSRKVAQVRKGAMRRFGWSRAQYREVMEEYFGAGDPGLFQGRYDPSRLLIIDGALDTCMNRESRDALWQATGQPERYRILSTHRWGFMALTPLALNQATKKIFAFLIQRPTDPARGAQSAAPRILLASTDARPVPTHRLEANR
jgi:hypothetical protein